jgi:glutamine synthetase
LTDVQREQAGMVLLSSSQAEALEALDESSLLRGILGNETVDAVVAVRRYEYENYGDLPPEELANKFRLAWSV